MVLLLACKRDSEEGVFGKSRSSSLIMGSPFKNDQSNNSEKQNI